MVVFMLVVLFAERGGRVFRPRRGVFDVTEMSYEDYCKRYGYTKCNM
jgi:hypothetical protein